MKWNDNECTNSTEQNNFLPCLSPFDNALMSVQDVPTTPRMKALYSSLVSDSESSGLPSSRSSSPALSDDGRSCSRNKKYISPTRTRNTCSVNSSPCRTSYYQSVNSPVRNREHVNINRSSSDDDSDNILDAMVPCTISSPGSNGCSNNLANLITPAKEYTYEDSVPHRTSYYQSVGINSNSISGTGTRKSATKRTKSSPVSKKLDLISDSKCISSYYRSLQSAESTPGQKSFQDPSSQPSSPPFSSSKKQQSGMKSRRRGSAFSKYNNPISEIKNPYYRSVQKLSSTNENNEVVIFGRPPVHTPDDQSRLLGKSGTNREHDDDLTTLITASETATVISGEHSHWNMTDAGTIVSSGNDYQSGLSSMPSSPTRFICHTANNGQSCDDKNLDRYKLCTPVRDRVKQIEQGSASKSTPKTPITSERKTKATKGIEIVELDADSDIEDDSESLASDMVVTSMIMSGDEVESPKIPRKIAFKNDEQKIQMHYTSLKDLIVTHDFQQIQVGQITIASHSDVRESFLQEKCTNNNTGTTENQFTQEDLRTSADLDNNDPRREEKLERREDHTSSSSPILEINVDRAENLVPFIVQNEESTSRVSPAKNLTSSFRDSVSVVSTQTIIYSDIKIGTIANLDLLRKEKCEEDECNFSLFGARRQKGNEGDECNFKCNIM